MSNDEAVKELADMVYARDAYERTGTIWFDEQIALFLERNIVIPHVKIGDSDIRDNDGSFVSAGEGPEEALATVTANPQWLRNKGVNFLRIADYVECRDAILAAKEAMKTAARDKRREEIMMELNSQFTYKDLGGNPFAKAVDRIIDLELAACE